MPTQGRPFRLHARGGDGGGIALPAFDTTKVTMSDGAFSSEQEVIGWVFRDRRQWMSSASFVLKLDSAVRSRAAGIPI